MTPPPALKPASARLAALAAVFFLTAAPAVQTKAAAPAVQTKTAAPAAQTKASRLADLPDVRNAEAYLDSLRTLKARFVQTDNNGQRLSGEFLLKRPGRMRFQYDPPMTDFIVADGTFVHYYDGQMKQQSSAPIGRTLANFFLRAEIGFGTDLRIEDARRDANRRLSITLTQAKDPLAGSITLFFDDVGANSLVLAGWRVLDPQGLTTDIRLENAVAGIKLGNDLFHYYDPKLSKPRYN
jgi:outer membrane lipoprotein-sorting protein